MRHETDEEAVAALKSSLASGERVEIWLGAVFVATVRGAEVIATLA